MLGALAYGDVGIAGATDGSSCASSAYVVQEVGVVPAIACSERMCFSVFFSNEQALSCLVVARDNTGAVEV